MATQPEVIQGSGAYPSPSPGPVVTIGNFDGVHRGHRTLIDRAVSLARAGGRPALVYTFHPAPRDVLRPGNAIPRIQTLEDKVAALGAAGIDQVVIEPFDRDFAALTARRFVEEILVGRLGLSGLVVGWDFRFGRGRQGTVEALRGWLDVPVEQVAPYAPDGRVISSSAIREAVRAGEVALAAELLGRPHEVVGEVVRGDARGRRLGFPTANVAPRTALVPAHGIYLVRMDVGDGERRPGVASIGVRPTFEGGRDERLEVHLLDWSGDLYGRTVRVYFLERLRDELAFESTEALVAQIAEDVAVARERLA